MDRIDSECDGDRKQHRHQYDLRCTGINEHARDDEYDIYNEEKQEPPRPDCLGDVKDGVWQS